MQKSAKLSSDANSPFEKNALHGVFRLNHDYAPVILKDREGYFSFHSLPFGLFTVSNMRDIFLEEPLCTSSVINNGKIAGRVSRCFFICVPFIRVL